MTTKFQQKVLYLAALVHLLQCQVVQQALMTVVVNMVLKKAVESTGSARMDQTEKQPVMGVNVVLTTVLLADGEMNQKRLVSVHTDQKQLVLALLVIGQLQQNEEMVHLTLVLKAVACKAYNGL